MNDSSFATLLFGQLSWGALPFVRAWRDLNISKIIGAGTVRSWCWMSSPPSR